MSDVFGIPRSSRECWLEERLTPRELAYKRLVVDRRIVSTDWLLSSARSAFLSDRIGVEQFEYEVERALATQKDPLDA